MQPAGRYKESVVLREAEAMPEQLVDLSQALPDSRQEDRRWSRGVITAEPRDGSLDSLEHSFVEVRGSHVLRQFEGFSVISKHDD